jgi:WD40 repeat protein
MSKSPMINPRQSIGIGDEISEDGSFFDAIGHRDDDENSYDRSITPETSLQTAKVDNTPYVRLENFAGLSSPVQQDHEENSKSSVEDDDKISPRGSLISSLTSFSEHQQAIEQLQQRDAGGRESPPLDFDPLRESPVHPYNLRSDMLASNISPDPKKPSIQFENDIISAYKNLFVRDAKAQEDIRPSSPVFATTSKPTKTYSPNLSASKYMKWVSSNTTQEPILSFMSTKLCQTISHHQGPVWVAKFSPDGKYLCTGGQDCRAYVWIVGLLPLASSYSSLSNIAHSSGYEDHDDSHSHDSKEEMYSSQNRQHNNPDVIIHPEPYRIYEGHTADIVDIAWSKSNFILTASLDKTVSLWLVSSSERIQFFQHSDIVTSVDFHPIHDRYFISGCFDRRLRFWDILPDGHVRAWAQTPDTITSVSFDPTGNSVVGGLFNGQVYFYTFDMKYITQINCRNKSGSYRDGRKVTGISFIKKETPASASSEEYRPKVGSSRDKLIISTNDHRLRLIQTENYSLVTKYLGLKNSSMQIKASLSDDGRYVISGSEDGKIYCWMTSYTPRQSWLSMLSKHNNYTNQHYECLDITSNAEIAVTSAVFAPAATSYHLLFSHQHRSRVHDASHQDLNAVDKIREKIDPILSANNVDVNDLSTRIIVATDYEGKIRIYTNQSQH